MVRADWGVEEKSLGVRSVHGPPRLPAEMPEVLEQATQGFQLLDDSTMWSFAPALWPREHRRWVEDHSTRVSASFSPGGPVSRHPWTAWDYFDTERDANELLQRAGLPPRPAGRLWVLRPPARFPDLDTALTGPCRHAVAEGAEPSLNRELVENAARVVARWVDDGWR